MDRRHFLSTSAAMVSAPALLGGCGSEFDRGLVMKTFAEAFAEFERVGNAKRIISHGVGDAAGWSLAQIAEHCTQSIEFALYGFPKEKSALFQATAGKAAFAVFELRGKMSHNTTEPIPSAPPLTATALAPALARLRASATALTTHTGGFKPHFAYGALSKDALIAANVFHIANHLSKIEIVEA